MKIILTERELIQAMDTLSSIELNANELQCILKEKPGVIDPNKYTAIFRNGEFKRFGRKFSIEKKADVTFGYLYIY